MTRLDKNRIIDPVVRIKLDLDVNEKQRITATNLDNVGGGGGQVPFLKAPSKQSSNRVEREIKSVQQSAFNAMEAISKVLADAKQNQKLNQNVTQKVRVCLEREGIKRPSYHLALCDIYRL